MAVANSASPAPTHPTRASMEAGLNATFTASMTKQAMDKTNSICSSMLHNEQGERQQGKAQCREVN